MGKKNRKTGTRKNSIQAKNENGRKRKKTEKKKRKKSENMGSDTVPANPFAKSRESAIFGFGLPGRAPVMQVFILQDFFSPGQSCWAKDLRISTPSRPKTAVSRGFSNVPWRKSAFGPGTKYVFLEICLGPCVRGRGPPWYGTSAQPESHFTRSSPRDAPRVVPSTSLLNHLWAFLGALGRGEGAPLVRYLCKTQKSLHGRHV